MTSPPLSVPSGQCRILCKKLKISNFTCKFTIRKKETQPKVVIFFGKVSLSIHRGGFCFLRAKRRIIIVEHLMPFFDVLEWCEIFIRFNIVRMCLKTTGNIYRLI